MGREMLNGWTNTVPFEKCRDAEGINYVGMGISPDVAINPAVAILDGRVMSWRVRWPCLNQGNSLALVATILKAHQDC